MLHTWSRTAKKKAFTLLELIVVIVILGVLAAIAVPTFAAVIQKSSDEATLTSLRAMAREAQALEAFDQNGWDGTDVTTAASDTTAAAPGVYAAKLTATKDAGKDPAPGEVTYVIDGAGLALSKLSDSGRVCVVGANYSAVEKGSCGPSTATTSSSTLGVVLSDPNVQTFPAGTETSAPAADTTPPATPAGLAATAGDGFADVSWSAVTDADLTGYRIYVDGVLAKDVPASALSIRLTLANGATYAITISSYDATGNASTQSAAVSASPVSAVIGSAASAWGENVSRQLGDGTTTNRLTPVAVNSPIANASALSVGTNVSCTVQGGKVYCWGGGAAPAEVAGLTGVTDVARGQSHTCALLSDSTARCWGGNSYGQLGDGTTTGSATPVVVSGLTGATQIIAGAGYSCALLSDSTAKCWGENSNGQLGDGTTTNRLTPVAVSGLTGAASLDGGQFSTCSVLADGTAKCWGYNAYGQLGDGTTTGRTTPVVVSGLSTITSLDISFEHACATLSDGTAKCWGRNSYGVLGDGTTTNRLYPVTVSGISTATSVTVGSSHSCALLSDTTVKCWGYNGHGQLGNGTTTNSTKPVAVSGLTGVKALVAGFHSNHTVVLRD